MNRLRRLVAPAMGSMLLLASISVGAAPRARARAAAAANFDRGRSLYQRGLFREAIEAFTAANRAAPHQAAVFNIARCHENLGDWMAALRFYEQALTLTQDPAKQRDIEGRMARIKRRPLDVLVSTLPPGASITVDGRAEPEARTTPTVVRLPPGEHVLLLRRDGYRLQAERVVVTLGEEHKVQARLVPQPRPAAPAPPCPEPQPCPPPPVRAPLVQAKGLHLHAALMAAVGLTEDRHLSAGPGIQIHASYERLLLGVRVVAFVTEAAPLGTPVTLDGLEYDKHSFRRLQSQIEAGWIFPFEVFYFYATGGAGFAADRAIFANGDTDKDFVRERFAFIWSLGGGVEAQATSWVSFGAALRFGVSHGEQVNRGHPNEVNSGHFPHGLLWGSVTFHL